MDRRSFLSSAGIAALATALPGSAWAQVDTGAADARLRSLLDSFFYDRLNDNPEQATRLGLDTGARAGLKSRLTDGSLAGRQRDQARLLAERKALAAIDRAALSPAAQIDHDVVDYQIDRDIAGLSQFTYGSSAGLLAPYVISQLTGPYVDVPDFLDSQHRVSDVADAEAYLSRLSMFSKSLDDSSEQQKVDAARGVFAPDFILDTTLKQLKALRDQPAAQTVLVTSFVTKLKAAGIAGDHAARAERIVADAIFPALDRQNALVSELRAKATHDAGVWRLPDGEAYYSAAAQAATTTSLKGDEIHALGLDQVAQISAQIDAILKAQGMSQGSVGERMVALNKRPDQLFANTDEGRAALLEQLNTQIKAMYARLPEAFSTMPKASVEVRRVPPHIQAGAPGGYYQNASLDGTRPAIYFINLRDTFDRPKFGLATLTHHEAVAGHHLQVSLALESTEIPMIRRGGGFGAYSEGWALYAEQLADEMGMFDGDPLGKVGYLQSLLFRATRLVVDSGLHTKRWSREKATDFLIATTGIARGRSQGEIDRYSVWPGQACGYKIGHTVWNRLRDETRAQQGAGFDLKAFHGILQLGGMPLTILERTVKARIAG